MTNKGTGNLIYIKWDTGVLIGLTDKSIDFEADMLDITDQQSTESWKEYTPGEKGATINFSGLYADTYLWGVIRVVIGFCKSSAFTAI